MTAENGAVRVRRELMIRFVRALDEANPENVLDRIPVQMRPRGEASSRCCIYHDRAVLKYRLMNLLGFACPDEEDEARSLASYYNEAKARASQSRTDEQEKAPLSVCPAGCSSCPPSRVVVTGNCRGCFARPCLYNCPRKAIRIENQVSVIDQDKCVKCGKCLTVCPFHAIAKTSVPCEEACPVGAIRKTAQGVEEIDLAKCIFCGKCFAACPFGAVMERSQLFDVLATMRRGEPLVALVAPSAEGQFPGTLAQLFSAIVKAGFRDVLEVALGAEMTTENETHEFLERMQEAGETLMTTSCCPAYVELVKKHLPAFFPHVSTTPSPMRYARDIALQKHPNVKTVFIGPCVAKRVEAQRYGIDYVLTFEELGALFAGRGIDVISCEEWPMPRPASATARNYARSCGVTEAVLAEAGISIPDFHLNSQSIDGLDRKAVARLKILASKKADCNFLEVMACQGGCCAGPCSLRK